MNHGEIVSFLWGVADLIRDTFKRGKYQDVILPLTVLRRIDCVLAPTKTKVAKGDYPYGIPVPGKPHLVESPYSPGKYIDVEGFPPGTEVKDPYTDKIFLVP